MPKFPNPDDIFSAIDKAGSAIDKGLGFIDKVSNRLDKMGLTEEPRAIEEPQSRTSSPTTGVSKLTSEETIAYQKREIAKELWQLEKHLAQGCRIPDKTGKRIPCDCCYKGSWIAGLAYESIPVAERAGQTSDIFEKIASWAEELTPMVTVAAVESGQHDYKKLSGEASALRKELMGSLALGAMIEPKEQLTLEDAKKIAAEEAAKEVESKWHSQEKKQSI